MADCQVETHSNTNTKSLNAELESLREENVRLKREIRQFETKHSSAKALLDQKIGFLEEQIINYKEREENIKKTNQTIMNTLENIGNEGAKNALKVKAIQELEKANHQYSQSLFEMKLKMKEEITKLEIENKKLESNVKEKDYKLKTLKDFIQDLREGYLNLKPTMIVNSRSSPQKENKEWGEWNFHRRSTLPGSSTKEEMRYNLNLGNERKRDELIDQNDLLIIDERNKLFIRSPSQPLETAASESKCQNLNKVGASESADLNKNFVHKDNFAVMRDLPLLMHQKEQIPSLGLLLSNPVSPRHDEIPTIVASSAACKDNQENIFECSNEQKFQVPTHVFNVSTLTINSEVLKAMPNDQSSVCLTLDPQAFEEKKMLFDKKRENLKDQLFIKDFWRSKVSSIQQQSVKAGGFSSAREILDIQDYNEDQNSVNKNQTMQRFEGEYSYKPQMQDHDENTKDSLQERVISNRISNMKNSTRNDTYNLRHKLTTKHTRSKNLSSRMNFLEGENNDHLQSETKFMMGRLLKVKNKLDKKSIELNASIAQGWEQSQANLSGFTKIETRRGSNNLLGEASNLMLRAGMIDTSKNTRTPRQTINNEAWSGIKEDFCLKKSYR